MNTPSGSLTTAGYDEGVTWYVASEFAEISQDQLDALRAIGSHSNVRDTQVRQHAIG
jgi:carbonic anhydrase